MVDGVSSYLSSVPASVLLPFYASLLIQQNAPNTSSTIQEEYDYIIVGGGSAGSVVASRLSEERCARVLLLEAGGPAPHTDDVPLFGHFFWFSDYDWAYRTEPQTHSGRGLVDNKFLWPSGKGFGGSGLLNDMLYSRGAKKNYDDWHKMGAKGWSYRDVFPYFLKLEDYQDEEYAYNGYHHKGGPITVEKPRYESPLRDLTLEGAKQLGHSVRDSAGSRLTGFYNISATIRKGQRCSPAKGYLVPASGRPNLDMVGFAHVNKVVMNGTQALGVEFDWQNQSRTVRARREVILSAGTVNTAQLLMLSGIGPRDHLEELKIPVVLDLPVGESMENHCAVPIIYEIDPHAVNLTEEVQKYTKDQTGVLSSAGGCDVMAYLNTKNKSEEIDDPDVELFFGNFEVKLAKHLFGITQEVFDQVYRPYENSTTRVCFSTLTQPRGSGSVKLTSTDPYDQPLIDPQYLKDPEDLKVIVEGLKLCDIFSTSAPMQRAGAKPLTTLIPGCEDKAGDKDEYFTCMAQTLTSALSHASGTARMGHHRDSRTVVTPELKIKRKFQEGTKESW